MFILKYIYTSNSFPIYFISITILNEATLPFYKTKARWPHFKLFIAKLNMLYTSSAFFALSSGRGKEIPADFAEIDENR